MQANEIKTMNGHLTGYIFIRNAERAEIYTSLSLDTINFDILKKNPSLFAYLQNDRRKKTGGVI